MRVGDEVTGVRVGDKVTGVRVDVRRGSEGCESGWLM